MRLLISLSLLLLAFSSCTPLRVVRVAPERPDEVTRYDYGSAVLEANTAEANVGVSYYDATAAYLVFNLQITNLGTEALLFEPTTVSLTTDRETFTPAIDPEIYLLEHDLSDIRSQRKARVLGWVGAGVMVASTVTLALDVPLVDVGNEVVSQELTSISTDLAFLAVNVAENRRRQAALPPPDLPTPDQRAFWIDHTLRITTIAPGETAFGKVVFARQDLARNLRFTVPLPEGEVDFDFVQVAMDGR